MRAEGLRKILLGFEPIAIERGWHTHQGALGMCIEATLEFYEYCLKFGIDESNLRIVEILHRVTGGLAEHVVLAIRLEDRWYAYERENTEVFVDWTARQFTPIAEFPCVWTESS